MVEAIYILSHAEKPEFLLREIILVVLGRLPPLGHGKYIYKQSNILK